MEKQDITLTCIEASCKKPFIFRVKDQLFYEEQNFTPPKRCFDCRAAKKANKQGGNRGNYHSDEQQTTAPADYGSSDAGNWKGNRQPRRFNERGGRSERRQRRDF